MSDVLYAVIPDELETAADQLRRAAEAVRRLREHPGVLRARARDCGDDDLALAVTELAGAWRDGLDEVGGQATRLQVLLSTAAQSYVATEQAVVPAGLTRRLTSRPIR